MEKVLTLNLGLISVELVSEMTGTNQIRRSWNKGFEYYHVENSAVPDFDILSLELLTPSLSYKPSARYTVYLSVETSI